MSYVLTPSEAEELNLLSRSENAAFAKLSDEAKELFFLMPLPPLPTQSGKKQDAKLAIQVEQRRAVIMAARSAYLRMTASSFSIILTAFRDAKSRHVNLKPEHILRALAMRPEGTIAAIFTKLRIHHPSILETIDQILERRKFRQKSDQPAVSERTIKVFLRSAEQADLYGDALIGTDCLLLGIVHRTSSLDYRIMSNHNVTPELVRKASMR